MKGATGKIGENLGYSRNFRRAKPSEMKLTTDERRHPAALSCGLKRGLVGVFQNGNGLFTRHIRETIQVFVEAQAAFQIVEQAVHRHARARETGSAAQSFRVNPDGNFRRKVQ
jgi:hypothetical protein